MSRLLALLLAPAFGVALTCAGASVAASASALAGCQVHAIAAQKRVDALAQRVRASDGLYRFVAAALGEPAACAGDAGGDTDHAHASAEFRWQDGTVLKTSYAPPEISQTVLSISGARELPGLMEAFREYVADKGLSIDWSKPQRSTTGGRSVREYHDPDPGLNGIVRIVYGRGNAPLSLSVSLAP